MTTASKQFSRHVSVPSHEGARVDKAITIHRPVAEVYSFWHKLENLPRFMRHIECITEQDDLHSHWIVKTVGGKTVEWDAEIIEQRENEMISWRSAPGADVDNAGSVWFTPTPGGEATLVRVEMKYVPPAGKAADLLAKIFGRDAESEIEENLKRLKALLETGQLPEEINPSAWRAAGKKARDAVRAADDYVHENPWTSVACTAVTIFVVGFSLGWILSRRD